MDTTSSISVTAIGNKDFVHSITDITTQTIAIRNKIFKNQIKREIFSSSDVNTYMNAINSFLRYWDDISISLENTIKRVNGVEGVHTIPYAEIKEVIYGSYDWESVLLFTDGIIKGIGSGKFNNTADINEFKNYTIKRAFNQSAESAAGLVDELLGYTTDNPVASNAFEASMFDSVKTYQGLFNHRVRESLYRSIQKTVTVLTDPNTLADLKSTPDNPKDYRDTQLYLTSISSVFDVITYALTMFSGRIWLINAYCKPYIVASNNTSPDVVPVTESSEESETETIQLDTIPRVFHDSDENILREPENFKMFMTTFAIYFGWDSEEEKDKMINNSVGEIKNNLIYSKLEHNPLIKVISNIRCCYPRTPINLDSIKNELRSVMYNGMQGLESSTTARQGIIHTLRGISGGRSIESQNNLMKELFNFTKYFLGSINDAIASVNSGINTNKPCNDNYSTSMIKIANQSLPRDITAMLEELYHEIATIIIHRARDIEMQVDAMKVKYRDEIMNSFDLSIPGIDTDILKDSNMTTVAPDTVRMPQEIHRLYELPVFESLQLYDWYLQTLPQFENDPYFTEAADGNIISNLINKLIAFIQAQINRFREWWGDKKVQKGFIWVEQHKNDLKNLKFTGTAGDAVIHNIRKFADEIGLPPGFDKLEKGIKNIKLDDVLSSDENIDKFIKELYPDETVYGWFNDNQKTADSLYKNMILFYKTSSASHAAEPPIVASITGAEISTYLDNWVSTVCDGRKLYDNINKMFGDRSNDINRLKSNLEKYVNDKNKEAHDAKNNSTNTNDTTNQAANNNSTNNTNHGADNSTTRTESIDTLLSILNGDKNISVYEEDGSTSSSNNNGGSNDHQSKPDEPAKNKPQGDTNGQQTSPSDTSNSSKNDPPPTPSNEVNYASYANRLLNGISSANARLFASLPLIFIDLLSTEYKYIQKAYNVALK